MTIHTRRGGISGVCGPVPNLKEMFKSVLHPMEYTSADPTSPAEVYVEYWKGFIPRHADITKWLNQEQVSILENWEFKVNRNSRNWRPYPSLPHGR